MIRKNAATIGESSATVAVIALARVGVFGRVRRHTAALDTLVAKVVDEVIL